MSLAVIPGSALAALRAARTEYRWLRSLRGSGRAADLGPIDLPISGRYVVSSDKGVYHLADGRIRRLCDIPAFGIAIAGRQIYLATWYGSCSVVLAGDFPDLLAGGGTRWRELYRVNYLTPAGRIHQIAATGDSLWLANTARNVLTKIDRRSGAWQASAGPFKCAFGHPILNDHNHLNSVFAQPRYLVFGAFKINRRSAFGLIGEGNVRLYAWPNTGIHDCFFSGQDFVFSDTARMWESDKPGHAGGVVVRGGKPVDKDYFDRTPARFVRGLAGNAHELLIGNSHVGDRADRFAGHGELLLVRAGRVTHRATFPGAQVYDILDEAGRHTDAPIPASYAEAAACMDQALGQPIDEFRLRDILSGPENKKWDASDIGNIPEYLREPAT